MSPPADASQAGGDSDIFLCVPDATALPHVAIAEQPRVATTGQPRVGVEDAAYQRFARLTQSLLDTAVSLVSFVDERGQVFPGAVGLPEPWARTRASGLSHSFCQYVVAANGPMVVSDARTVDFLQDNLAIGDLSAIAYAGFPLHDLAGRAVGSLCAIDPQPRMWSTRDLEVLADLAAACSSEIQLREARAGAEENRRLAASAQKRALRAHQTSTVLLDLAEAFADTSSVDDVLDTMQAVTVSVMGAQWCSIALLIDNRLVWERRSGTARYPEHAWRDTTLAERTVATHSLGQRDALYFEDGARLGAAFPELSGGGDGAAVLVPLRTSTGPLGVVAVRWSEPRPLERTDLPTLRKIGVYGALALERARLLEERRQVAHRLQEAMLTVLPRLEHVRLDHVYEAAADTEQVGGDWYDVLELRDGSIMLAVGDVTGHDLEAATYMGQLRSLLRGFAWSFDEPPGRTLTRLDETILGTGLGAIATVVLALLSPVRGDGSRELRWSNAGHLPPLVRRQGGSIELLDAPHGLPVGLATRDRGESTTFLMPGDSLVLYTDGLLETRHESLRISIGRLAEVVAATQEPTAQLLLDSMEEFRTHEDDTVVLTVRV